MTIEYPRAIACGDSGVSIEFGDRIDVDLNERVLALDDALRSAQMHGVIETVPTYRALLIHYDPVEATFDSVAAMGLALSRAGRSAERKSRRLELPVCYEGEFGIDLTTVSERLGLRTSDVIDRHTECEYRVYMLGFQPGFAYLGGLDPALSLQRRPKPRLGAPAGTISIAAGQCAVHAVEHPSGWHWIGRTPVSTLRGGTKPHFTIEPGDHVRFYAVSTRRWHELHRADAAGEVLVEDSA